MAITAADVKKLRDMTNAPMMDCKAALTVADGDFDKAIEELRKKNASIQAKRGEKETAEGRVTTFIDPEKKVGAIVEVQCESAPVAKAEAFIKLADDLAKHVAETNPESVETMLTQPMSGESDKTVNDRVGEVIGLIRENMKPARIARMEGLLGSYCHHDGSVGVLLQVEGDKADPQLLRDICMHITAATPMAGRREDMPKEIVDKEKEIAKAQAEELGKPANIAERIAEGKMKTFFAQHVLLEQPFVKDDSKTVGDLLKAAGLEFKQYVRFKVGEKE